MHPGVLPPIYCQSLFTAESHCMLQLMTCTAHTEHAQHCPAAPGSKVSRLRWTALLCLQVPNPDVTQKKRLEAGKKGAMISPTATKDLQRPLTGATLCALMSATGAAAAVPFVPPFVDATASKLTTFPYEQVWSVSPQRCEAQPSLMNSVNSHAAISQHSAVETGCSPVHSPASLPLSPRAALPRCPKAPSHM